IADHVAHELRAGDAALGIRHLERAAIAVGVRRGVLARDERSQMVLEVAPEEAEHTAGLAVEPAPEAEDLVLARGDLGQTQRRLHRLRSAGEHLDAGQPSGQDRGDQLEEAGARLRGEAAKSELLHLLLERLHVVGMAVAHGADGDARDEVDVLLPILVDQHGATAARHGQPRVEGESLHARGGVAPLARNDLLRTRTRLADLPHRPPRPRRTERWPAGAEAAPSRKSAKLGPAFRSMGPGPPGGVTMQPPP